VVTLDPVPYHSMVKVPALAALGPGSNSHVGYRRGIADLVAVVVEGVRELFPEYAFPARLIDALGALLAATVALQIPALLGSNFRSFHISLVPHKPSVCLSLD
jgi:hypothetical protein